MKSSKHSVSQSVSQSAGAQQAQLGTHTFRRAAAAHIRKDTEAGKQHGRWASNSAHDVYAESAPDIEHRRGQQLSTMLMREVVLLLQRQDTA